MQDQESTGWDTRDPHFIALEYSHPTGAQALYLSHQLTLLFGTFILLGLDFLLWFLPSGLYHTLDSLLRLHRLLKCLHYGGSSDFTALLRFPAGHHASA